MKKQKPKKCKYSKCKKEFMPWSTTQTTCNNPTCAFGYAAEKKAKKEKREHVTAKKSFNLSDKPLQKKLTQALVNKYIRLRDDDRTCISCLKYTGQMQAGHYLSVGSHPNLRYAARNIHKQCATCNNHLSGNLLEFRKGLIKRYGVAFVESLESDQTPRKFSNDEVILIGKYYKGMIKEMEP
jgi:hypothetical protein